MTIVGIDPGKKGGLAALDAAGDVVGVWPMPIAGGEIYAAELASIFRSLALKDPGPGKILVCIEKVSSMPRQGVVSTFKFGCGYGMIRGVCAALGLPVSVVPPTMWKKKVLAGLTHDKAGAVQYCTARWPNTELVMPGCRVPHDGIADALCLAEYGRKVI